MAVKTVQQQPSGGQQAVQHHVLNNRVGLVIGKGGETVRELQEKSGAKIVITPDKDADPNAPYRIVNIVGTAETIQRARDLIDEVAAGGPNVIKRDNERFQTITPQYTQPPRNAQMPPYMGQPPNQGNSMYPPFGGPNMGFGMGPPPQNNAAAGGMDAIDLQIPNEMAGALIGRGMCKSTLSERTFLTV